MRETNTDDTFSGVELNADDAKAALCFAVNEKEWLGFIYKWYATKSYTVLWDQIPNRILRLNTESKYVFRIPDVYFKDLARLSFEPQTNIIIQLDSAIQTIKVLV